MDQWQMQSAPTKPGEVEVLVARPLYQGEPVSWEEVLSQWQGSAPFRAWLHEWLGQAPFDFQLKIVPWHPDTRSRPWFFALAPSRFAPADAQAYREHLDPLAEHERVASFWNLSGQSRLVIPCEDGAYGHLRAFCQRAPEATAQAFWARCAQELTRWVEDGEPCWPNTHGHGVPWLHMRLDPTHKYATFPPSGAIDAGAIQRWYNQLHDVAFGDG